MPTVLQIMRASVALDAIDITNDPTPHCHPPGPSWGNFPRSRPIRPALPGRQAVSSTIKWCYSRPVLAHLGTSVTERIDCHPRASPVLVGGHWNGLRHSVSESAQFRQAGIGREIVWSNSERQEQTARTRHLTPVSKKTPPPFGHHAGDQIRCRSCR